MTEESLEALQRQLAILQHSELTWKAEAERLNSIVHAQRKTLEQLRQLSMVGQVRTLLRLLGECEPIIETLRSTNTALFPASRLLGLIDEIAVTRKAILVVLAQYDGLL